MVCHFHFTDPLPPTAIELPPIPVDDPFGLVTLSWTKPNLTDDNKEFFTGYNITINRTVLQQPMLASRKKRQASIIPNSDSQSVIVDPDATSYTYNTPCPYVSGATLCPYSQYCFTVVSMFTFSGVFINSSRPNPMCTGNTAEAGKVSSLCNML